MAFRPRPDDTSRAAILSLAREEPGTSATQIARRVGLTLPTVLYHARRMQKMGLVHVDRTGRGVRLFPPDARRTELPLSTIVGASSWRVALTILDHPDLSFAERAAVLGVSRQAIQRHVAKLTAAGLLAIEPTSRRFVPTARLLKASGTAPQRPSPRRSVSADRILALEDERSVAAMAGVNEG